MKEITLKSKRHKQTIIHQNNTTITDLSKDPTQIVATPSVHQHSMETAGPINKLNNCNIILRILNEWYDKNCHAMNISNGKLIENEDFRLLITSNGSLEEACISSCGVKVQLPKIREYFSLSNYYKHMKSKNCSMIKKKKSTSWNANNESSTAADHETFDGEASLNISMNDHPPLSASTITVGTTIDTDTSVKRSIS
ncbi:unnamed protein product [Rotaria sp. Silwood2]|nr:unnamed protein product [Rotaria sp. Silwood2]CAF4471492.1 unnamed protein product [Rotaria sp. Silwood2]